MKNVKLLLLYIILINSVVYSQYFGRNKVQYERFDFKTLNTKNFSIMFYPEIEDAAEDAAFMLERWHTRFKNIFVSGTDSLQPIILYANHADFQQTNVISGLIPQGTGGVTEGFKNRIVLPFTGINEEDDHVLGHELVHAFQYNIIKSAPQGLASAGQVPLWFVEGLAEYLTIGRSSSLTAMWLRDAVLNDDLPSISDISRNYKYFPYRYGHALWSYIGSIYGDKIIAPLFSSVLFSGWEEGFKNTLKTSLDTLSENWEKAVKEIYKSQINGRTIPSETGKKLIGDDEGINMSPSLSPDGKTVAFISQRELFTLDLFLADAETGKIIRKLVSSNTDAHFDAIRVMNASGTWSPDSKKFAFMIIESGNEKLAVVNAATGDFEKVINIDGADAIYHASWSPDGKSIILSAGSGGRSDLFLLDLASGRSVRLTDDKYSDIQPSWSPDGKTIVFSTDRGSSNLDSLYFGHLDLALMNIDSKDITILPIDNAKHINPFFSSDGEKIYYVSDPDGFSNIYSYNLNNKEIKRLTNTATGISGLTENSPAISVSGNKIIFSIFNKATYSLRSINPDENIIDAPVPDSNYAALPYVNGPGERIVNNYLPKSYAGLKDTTYAVRNYSPALNLLYIGQPSVGVVFDKFNSGIGGGVSMLFGDMLGNHYLAAALQIQGTLKDLGGQVLYQNMTRRFNWGASIGHIPYMTGYTAYGLDTISIDGRNYLADVVTLIRERVFLSGLTLFAQYPLTTNRRFEVTAGYTRIGYDLEVENSYLVGGQIVGQQTESFPAPPSINLFHSAAAYIGDFSYFGFTSPVYGSRFRFEAEGTVGSFKFISLLGDYRRYFFVNPLTFALRGIHYGRYLGDSESNELSPLFLGYETFVRGYSVNSFDVSESNEFNRLIGSRIAVFNAEIRLPLFGTEQYGLINFPYLPTELSVFFDGGAAWTKDESPVLKWARRSTERVPVFSAGGAARVNVLGYIVLEFYYAYPFQRPDKSWQFGINLQPGW